MIDNFNSTFFYSFIYLEQKEQLGERMNDNKKILIFAGCSKKKLPYPAPAINLNQGQLFRAIKKLATNHKFDIKILSGKYGLLEPDTIIKPYDQKLTKKADIKRFSLEIRPTMHQILKDYDTIIVVMGKVYRQVLEPYYNSKFRVVIHKKGIFGYLHLLSQFNKFTTRILLAEIEKYKFTKN
ncbi:hypothetical protein LCGC14_2313690 [marine sediment metagenome]|uniref:DUF6884 domain-containing protein n=1 Tax=marine sediment metagenome TaxID=412755 RepID=A0A0F9EXB6_9ZZZZ